MHTSGKVALGLMMVMWIACLVLAVKVVHIRGEWLSRIQKLQKEIEDKKLAFDKESKARKDAKAELDRANFGWGFVYDGVLSDPPDPATNSFQIRASDGKGQPFLLTQGQVIWIFQPAADGNSSEYRGSFKVSGIGNGTYSVAPNQRLRIADPLAGRAELVESVNLLNEAMNPRPVTWDSVPTVGGPLRIRTSVPSDFVDRQLRQEMELVRSDESIIERAVEYSKQVALLDAANKLVQLRTEEITGSPELAARNAPDEFKLGLLKALQDEEELRNKFMLSVDDLRHRLKRTNERFAEVRQRNSELEQTLPQPASAATASTR